MEKGTASLSAAGRAGAAGTRRGGCWGLRSVCAQSGGRGGRRTLAVWRSPGPAAGSERPQWAWWQDTRRSLLREVPLQAGEPKFGEQGRAATASPDPGAGLYGFRVCSPEAQP